MHKVMFVIILTLAVSGLIVILSDGLTVWLTTQQIGAEAQRATAQAEANQAAAELERAQGERAILEAAAQAVYADQQNINVIGSIGIVLIVMLFLGTGAWVWWVRQPHTLHHQTDWRHLALRWQWLALYLAATLRNKTGLTVADRRALDAVDRMTLNHEPVPQLSDHSYHP